MGGNRNRKSAALFACAALALLAAAACGGSANTDGTPAPGSTAVNTPAPGSTVIAFNTSTVPFATPTAVEITDDARTAVAAKGAVEMVPYTDKDGRYTTKLPRGWRIETNNNSLNTSLVIDPFNASLGIFCLQHSTVAQIQNFDTRIMQTAGTGVIPFDTAVPTQVGSLPAQAVYWQGNYGTIPLDRVFIYFEGNGCAWRIQMTAYPGVSLADLKPILDATTSSFAFTS